MGNKERRMAAHKQLMRVIYKTEQGLTDEEIFLGRPYKEYQSKVADGLTEKYGAHSAVEIFKGGDDAAYTDGVTTHINGWCPGFKVNDRVQRHRCITGLNVHEQAHRVWTNFPLSTKSIEEIGKGNPYPSVPADSSDDTLEGLSALRQFLTQHPETAGAVTEIYSHIDNCVCDGFVNRMALNAWPGYGQDLKALLEDEKNQETSYSEQKADGDDTISLLTGLILSEAKFGKVLTVDEHDLSDPVVQTFFKVRPVIDSATDELSSWFRQMKKNEVFLNFFKIISDEVKNQAQKNNNSQSGQNGNQGQQGGQNGQTGQNPQGNQNGTGQQSGQSNTDPSGNGNNTGNQGEKKDGSGQEKDQQGNNGEALKKAIENAAKAAAKFSSATSTSNNNKNSAGPLSDSSESASLSKSFDAGSGGGQGGSGSSPVNDGTGQSPAGSSSLDKVLNQTAAEKAKSEAEKELEKQLRAAIKDVGKDASVHKNVPTRIDRAGEGNGQGVYDSEHTRLDGIAKRMARNLLKELKDRQLGDSLNGNYFGSRLDSQNLSRRDKKLFIRDILPEDVPDMEVSVVVDQSGSMNGKKNMAAKRASYIIWKFCDLLDIPVNVIGHHTYGSDVKMESFADGASVDGKDGVRILGMGTGGCNRDGLPLRYALNKLYKSPAETKVLVMISDGCPNHGDYGIAQAKSDIQDAVSKARKAGVVVVTAGIGDDADNIRNVWTEGVSPKRAARFLSISDLDRLAKTLIDVIKKELE